MGLTIKGGTTAKAAFEKIMADAQKMRVKVGVLSETDKRMTAVDHARAMREHDMEVWRQNSPSNAQVGYAMEFGVATGSEQVPPRSFLRTPLETKLPDDVRANADTVIVPALQKDGIAGGLQALGGLARQTIDRAFETGGFGQWAPNSKRASYIKGSDKPLIDTGQLRASITSKVTT